MVLTVPDVVNMTDGHVMVVLIAILDVCLWLSLKVHEVPAQCFRGPTTMVEGSHVLIVSGGNVSVVLIVPLSVTVIRE